MRKSISRLVPHKLRGTHSGNESLGKTTRGLLIKIFLVSDTGDSFIEGFPQFLLLSFVFSALKPHFHPYHDFLV